MSDLTEKIADRMSKRFPALRHEMTDSMWDALAVAAADVVREELLSSSYARERDCVIYECPVCHYKDAEAYDEPVDYAMTPKCPVNGDRLAPVRYLPVPALDAVVNRSTNEADRPAGTEAARNTTGRLDS